MLGHRRPVFPRRPSCYGWGDVDDAQSILWVIHRALDLGVNFFDTADVYGAGHSEGARLAGLKGRRDQAVIATKFGFLFDETTRTRRGTNLSPSYIRQACEASLRRLQTDYIDLDQCHVGRCSPRSSTGRLGHAYGPAYGGRQDPRRRPQHVGRRLRPGVRNAIQRRCDPARRQRAAGRAHSFAVGEEFGLANIINSPLAMGLLSGKFTRETCFSSDDVRGTLHPWLAYFRDGRPIPSSSTASTPCGKFSKATAERSSKEPWHGFGPQPQAIPIPGFKTVAQVEENCSAMRFSRPPHPGPDERDPKDCSRRWQSFGPRRLRELDMP